MGDNIAKLEQRVALLEAQAAIFDLLYQYAHSIDYGDEQGFVDCFTEDAVWEAHNAVTGTVMSNTGHTELMHFVAGHTRPPELYHKHLIIEPRVHIDGDTASSTCYFVLVVSPPGGVPEVVTFGRYVDRLQRDAAGNWRIANRRAEAEGWNPLWGTLRDMRRKTLKA